MTQPDEHAAPPAPGVYEDVPAEHYHQWNHNVLSKSALWPMVTGINDDGSLELCPAKLRYEQDHPKAMTPDMILGEALDCHLLEPHEFEQRYVMAQSCQAPKKKGSDEVCGAPGKKLVEGEWRCGTHGRGGEDIDPDKTLLDHIQMSQVRAMARSIHQHEEASQYFTEPNHHQVACIGEFCGRMFKGRFDIYRAVGGGEVADLKKSHYYRPHQFQRHAVKMGWHVQMFLYLALAYKNEWVTTDARGTFIVAGDRPIFGSGRDAVYPIEVYEISDELLTLGSRHLQQLVDTYNRCEEAGQWPVNYEPRRVVSVPDWLGNQDESEATDE